MTTIEQLPLPQPDADGYQWHLEVQLSDGAWRSTEVPLGTRGATFIMIAAKMGLLDAGSARLVRTGKPTPDAEDPWICNLKDLL